MPIPLFGGQECVQCRYVTLPAVEGNASRGLIGNSTFLSAGASKPTVANSSDANECSLGETYRTGKRGGQYIGLTADIPYWGLVPSSCTACLACHLLQLCLPPRSWVGSPSSFSQPSSRAPLPLPPQPLPKHLLHIIFLRPLQFVA